jgi:hypothetical protein
VSILLDWQWPNFNPKVIKVCAKAHFVMGLITVVQVIDRIALITRIYPRSRSACHEPVYRSLIEEDLNTADHCIDI